ncbi:MAG: replication initiator protein A [Porticoccus sp.]|nr:replication initiator protein A [Porticoccus sp.]
MGENPKVWVKTRNFDTVDNHLLDEMKESKTKGLIPNKHPTGDLFICDVADAVIKDFHAEMEHPFYSLSKRPVLSIRRYQQGKNWLEITPSVKGLATIYDKDILIYAISQLISKLNEGEAITQKVRINAHEFLKFSNRGTAGKDYKAMCEAIDRLAGTRISTNIITGDEEQYENFGLIESGSIRRKNGLDGRIQWVELKISDWVFNAIEAKEVLTLHRDYFRLRKPIERRMYEVARKHCGRQPNWKVYLSTLHKKSGSTSSEREFRRAIKEIAASNHLPDYTLTFDAETDSVTFTNREAWWNKNKETPTLEDKEETLKQASKHLPPNTDVNEVHTEWVNYWIDSGALPLSSPEAAFIGFCKKYNSAT